MSRIFIYMYMYACVCVCVYREVKTIGITRIDRYIRVRVFVYHKVIKRFDKIVWIPNT